MRNHHPREETGRVLALAATLWGAVLGVAALEGAFARFEGSSLAMLAAFVSLFAVASYRLDPQLRAYARQADALRASAIALALALALAAAVVMRVAPLAMFLAPLAALASVAAAAGLLRRAGPRRATTPAAPAKSPGVNPAAT